jgi:protease IV
MGSFFKSFFASLLALIVFCLLGFIFFIVVIGAFSSTDKPVIASKAVLVLDMSKTIQERFVEDPFDFIQNDVSENVPGLYDIVRMLKYAKNDSHVAGVYIKCGNNANEMAANEELRQAIADFKSSEKFVIAYGEVISQGGYYLAQLADKIYCHPQGGLEWNGFASTNIFIKGLLDKLEIQPQIFYAGKFKSATEPLRETKMTEANRLQTSVFLGGMYNQFIQATAMARKLDADKLKQLAETGAIQTATDAVNNKLIDGAKYDDEVKAEIAKRLMIEADSRINFVTLGEYAAAVNYAQSGTDKIAIIYADGDIVDGDTEEEQMVAGDRFRAELRKVRLDNTIKAVVLRVNSPGGSALASDVIWREVSLIKKSKPVVVSMGNYAASGGYYISAAADFILANPSTITGSIGVFGVIPNMQSFLKNKLGITTDGVKTAPYADMGNITRPLSTTEAKFIQNSIDTVYDTFKARVADGRNLNLQQVDSIAQGRVWTGTDGKKNGLVDRLGTLQDAVFVAAKLAKLDSYGLRELPAKRDFLEQILEAPKKSIKASVIQEEIGLEQWKMLQQAKRLKQISGIPQTRIPFDIMISK